MVFCRMCGTENEDDAVECSNCGAPLQQARPSRPRRPPRPPRWEDDICFGARRGIPIWGIIFGVLIIIAGVISLLEDLYWWASWDRLWPVIVIAFGLLIVINALSKR